MTGPKVSPPIALPPGAWRALLVVAAAHGWEPRFPLELALGDADVTIEGDDATELADALEGAVADVPQHRIGRGPVPAPGGWPSLAEALARLGGLQHEIAAIVASARASAWVQYRRDAVTAERT